MGFHGNAESSGIIYLLFVNSFDNRTVIAVAAGSEAGFGQKLGLTPFRKPTKKPSENIQCFDAPVASAKSNSPRRRGNSLVNAHSHPAVHTKLW